MDAGSEPGRVDGDHDRLAVTGGDRSSGRVGGQPRHVGAGVVSAGTVSLLVSLPTVAVGVGRQARRGSYADRTDLTATIVPMCIGSIVGAVGGGLLVGLAPDRILKVILGTILIVSAARVFRH